MSPLDEGISNYVFVGPSGSGKTELSLNLASALARRQGRQEVVLFDLDQTKSMFRARDLAAELACAGVVLADTVNYQDAPLTPPGILRTIENQKTLCVLDVGGNATGSRMIGQYSGALRQGGSRFYCPLNPYRPFSEDGWALAETLGQLALAARIDPGALRLIANPCLGERTDVALIRQGVELLEHELAKLSLSFCAVTVPANKYAECRGLFRWPVYPIERFVGKLYL